MGLLSYTKRKGKRILDCICLTKSTKKTQQRHLPSPRFPPQQQVPPLAETKKKKRFWRKKKKDKANKKRTNNNNLVCQNDPQQQSQMCQRPAAKKKKRFWRLRKHKKDKNKCASVNNPNSRKKKSSCWRIRKTKKKSPCPLKKDEAIQQSQGHCQNETDQARMKKRKRSCWRIRRTKKNKKNKKTAHNATSRLEEFQQPRPCQAQPRQSQMQPTRQFQAQQQKEKKKAKWRWNLCGVKKNKKSKRRHPNFGEPTYLYEETELQQQVNDTRKKKKRFLCWRRKSRKDKREKGDKREKREKREKKEKREQNAHRQPNGLARLVSSLSFQSDSYKHRAAAQEILRIGNDNIPSRVFTLDELKVATKNFSQDNLLGEGGFGRVYLGHIPGTNETIGVKQLDRHGLQGNREFLVEVLMLSLLHHPNLVNLLGYCVENGQRILVYEYMQLGSLQDHLLDHSRNYGPLDWGTRMKIAAGAAKGLEFLHDAANPPVIYRDLKASNILLGEGFHPKLSDFGLAKLGPVGEKTHVTTRVMGTYGYCAPEYALSGRLTKMSDVYSFGVVLLELITGRRAVDTTKPTREQILVHWAAPLFKNKNRYAEMADPLLKGAFPIKGLYQALAISAMCLQEEAESRPIISDVVTALQFLADPKPDIVDCSDEFYPPPGHPPSSSDAEIEMCDEDDF